MIEAQPQPHSVPASDSPTRFAAVRQEFQQLLQGVREGSETAVREFLVRYGPAVLRVIRRRLQPRLRREYDSQDFLQDVMATFLCHPERNQQFAGPEALFAFLAKVAANKIVTALRHRSRRAGDVHREHSLDGSAQVQAQGLCADGPSPSEAASRREQWDRLVPGTVSTAKQILALLRLGFTPQEIAARMHMSARHVHRALERIRKQAAP
jgi:RNA polymerase sigma factor (sigma-70 family)